MQVWQTPVRQLQRLGTSQASASSSRLRALEMNRVEMPLRAKVTSGPVPTGPGGWCGWPGGLADHAGVGGRQRAEQLGMDAGRLDADSRECLPDVGHERRRAADVGIR